MEINVNNSNTSYVAINPRRKSNNVNKSKYSNTSYVAINQMDFIKNLTDFDIQIHRMLLLIRV